LRYDVGGPLGKDVAGERELGRGDVREEALGGSEAVKERCDE
jgi:hypothetical protein